MEAGALFFLFLSSATSWPLLAEVVMLLNGALPAEGPDSVSWIRLKSRVAFVFRSLAGFAVAGGGLLTSCDPAALLLLLLGWLLLLLLLLLR